MLNTSVLSELEAENEELKKRIERLKEEQVSKVIYLKKNVKEFENKIETVQHEYAEYKNVCKLVKNNCMCTDRHVNIIVWNTEIINYLLGI